MDIDERLAAITMNLELLSRDREDDRRRSLEQDRQIQEQGTQIQRMLEIAEKLVRTAEIHERRLIRVEGFTP